jgi:uncharacterized protein (TIGR02246 family)
MSKLFGCFLAIALTALAASPDDQAIRQVLTTQADDWNRGDIDAFMKGYNDSPDITFIGKTVSHGYRAVLERYHRQYPTRDNMGKLDFSGVEVKLLGSGYASVTGAFHLARTQQGGGEASGNFSLLFQKTRAGWKIILDHTS